MSKTSPRNLLGEESSVSSCGGSVLYYISREEKEILMFSVCAELSFSFYNQYVLQPQE